MVRFLRRATWFVLLLVMSLLWFLLFELVPAVRWFFGSWWYELKRHWQLAVEITEKSRGSS
jgi:hypothetical protein